MAVTSHNHFQRKLGIAELHRINLELGNCVEEYHRARSIIPPINQQYLYLAGNSRALTLKGADYSIISKVGKGATITQIEQ